jgi:hypothetical protein
MSGSYSNYSETLQTTSKKHAAALSAMTDEQITAAALSDDN